MISDIEEILRFNQTTSKHNRLKYRIKKPIKGLCFKEMLLKINNANRGSSHKGNDHREHKKSSHEEIEIDKSNVEDSIELMHLDKFC